VLSAARGGLGLLFFLLTTAPVVAQEIAVPVQVHVPLLVKILSFDRNLTARIGERVVLGVLYQRHYRTSANIADEVRRAAAELETTDTGGFTVHPVAIDLDATQDLRAALARHQVTVLYVSPLRAVDLATVIAATRPGSVTTLTGVPEYVETGLAVGIDLRGGRPEIVVNLPASRAEGADLNAQLLKLARVIQ
jgi:YfiR/HmsC-like